MSRRGRPLLSWQFGCKVPENVPEKTPGAWFTKLSMMAPGLRERVEGPVVAVVAAVAAAAAAAVVVPLGLLVLQLASGQRTGATGLAWLMSWLGWPEGGCWKWWCWWWWWWLLLLWWWW